VVIPTVGRSSVRAAAESALRQTVPPHEVIVVLDADRPLDLPDSPIVRVVRTSGGCGAGFARHTGVVASTGEVIALLDDDDTWLDDKLQRQLAAAPHVAHWVLSCRFLTRPEGRDPVLFPRRLYRGGDAVADYLFEFHTLRKGRSALQTSTLMFPRELAEKVPLSITAGSIHDEPLWLIAVQRTFPDLAIVQLPDPLVEYGLTANSLSRSTVDRSDEYIEWGLRELAGTPKRVQGDYHLTNPVSSAVAAGSLRGVLRSMSAATRSGRPGPWAWVYALGAVAKICAQKARMRVSR
jgi:hypothetical protein